VILQAEDGRSVRRLVAPDPLEDTRAVMQTVREHMHPRIVPGDERAVDQMISDLMNGAIEGGIMAPVT
jgi:hypothetical protein